MQVEDTDFEQEPPEVNLIDREGTLCLFSEQSRLELGRKLLSDLDVILENGQAFRVGELEFGFSLSLMAFFNLNDL